MHATPLIPCSNTDMPTTSPICCLLTNSGRGAVAVVGIAGQVDQIPTIVSQLFSPIGSRSFQTLIDQSDQVIFYGQWKSTAEDLVVAKTNFGFEVHCHGGDAASAAIIDDLNQNGCEAVTQQTWREFHADRWQAETEAAVCAATTSRTAKMLLQVLQNQTSVLSKLSDQIQSNQVPSAITGIEQSLAWAEFGLNLTRPRSIVLCGHPNVGKSSLINALAGFQRAIVNPQAGTTRDVLSQSTAIDGWPVDLKDTAGLRISQDQVEAMGIEKAKQKIARSQIRCLVCSCEDFCGDQSNIDQALAANEKLLKQLAPQLIIFNKSDLVPDFEIPVSLDFTGPTLAVSAIDEASVQPLVTCIADMLAPKLPLEDDWYPVSDWQIDRLQLTLQKLTNDDLEAARSLLIPS